MQQRSDFSETLCLQILKINRKKPTIIDTCTDPQKLDLKI
ncbi:hypothetical protein CMALT394_530081 [Carnobacterium maltaromaticum]|nr:hypothetical protein CMALT394_530081 [Carnobacterium maltaromaticum]